MPAITLDQANRIIDAILKRGVELDCRPMSAVVVEPGCVVKAFYGLSFPKPEGGIVTVSYPIILQPG